MDAGWQGYAHWLGNRSLVKEQQATKVACPCGGRYTIGQKSTHCKTLRHVAFTTEAGEGTVLLSGEDLTDRRTDTIGDSKTVPSNATSPPKKEIRVGGTRSPSPKTAIRGGATRSPSPKTAIRVGATPLIPKVRWLWQQYFNPSRHISPCHAYFRLPGVLFDTHKVSMLAMVLTLAALVGILGTRCERERYMRGRTRHERGTQR